ncbi:hypothetical protein J1770_gp73 [Gordonia phage EMoore]|uniref:DNA binding protein n=1 Tax=Gordonia phage EMoore TaxID=2656534 RepID=A0A649VU87_9CAUD|nr:hypothetical protein J1770_gp73 [Gordonia phage EMoore]QGJ95858.1 hypothetical protein SEA_EMOORE_73 [Gordonia phage EMoore]
MSKRKSPRPALGKACTVCGRPVVVPQNGNWHASCAKRCPICYDPVMSTDPGDHTTHDKCAKKRPKQ